MKVILLETIKALGKAGDQVQVSDGYGRNFLIPRKKAMASTSENMKVFENEKKARDKKTEKDHQEAVALSTTLAGLQLTVSRMAGEDDKLFGSVTNGDVAEALEKEGYKIDKRKIELEEPLKALGIFDVPVHLGGEVTAMVKVWVVKQ
jgi:large subunit ribosomal protein L9